MSKIKETLLQEQYQGDHEPQYFGLMQIFHCLFKIDESNLNQLTFDNLDTNESSSEST